MSAAPPPQAVLMIGIQATGKSTFVRERLFDTHVRINLDMLGTRHREQLLLDACLAAGQSFVVDNTNPTRAERARYIESAAAAGFTVCGFYFKSVISEALTRNSNRAYGALVPDRGVLGTHARLELPARDEGFDHLHYVRIENQAFVVEEWQDEVR